MTDNPLLQPFEGPFELTPFDRIELSHFRPALEVALAENSAEIEAIATDPATPSFANTVEALERSGDLLMRVAGPFYGLAGADSNDEIEAMEAEFSPRLAEHNSAIASDARLFARVKAVPTDGLTPEQTRVREKYLDLYTRGGAALDAQGRARMSAIASRQAALSAEFNKRVRAAEQVWSLPLSADDLEGLPEPLVEAYAADAESRGASGHLVTLARSSVEPFLTYSARRDLREQAWRAWTARGEASEETATGALISEMVALRTEKAKLLGYDTFAAFKLGNKMAKTPGTVRDLLMRVWGPAKASAEAEAAALQGLIAEEGGNFDLAAWDWRFYAEKLRQRDFDFDESEAKAYLTLDAMIEAAFYTANRLFGLSFSPLPDVPKLHPDIRAWEVKAADGAHVGVFFGDYLARPSKRGGAWKSHLRAQHRLSGEVRPVVYNTMNFAKGSPTLLSIDDARTLFHEFGHALHSLMSSVTYPSVSGTAVPLDFVELPSQLYEHWMLTRDVLSRFAKHYRTGAAMPEALIEKAIASQKFNQGFATVEYLSSALVDLTLHEEPRDSVDAATFEAETLDALGMPAQISMRHRLPHFSHLFSGDMYAAGYYSYMWSEVMDADAYRAFEEAGDPFDAETARRLAGEIYSAGDRQPPEDAYRAFRGRDPEVAALLAGRGLGAIAISESKR